MTPTTLLTKLLAQWKVKPHPRVGEAAEALAGKLLAEAPRPPLPGSKKHDDVALWKRVEADGDPLDFPRLMVAARGGQQLDVARQVRALARRKDPRFALGLLALLEKPPYAGLKSRPLLRTLIELLDATRDQRAGAPAKALSARYLGVVHSSTGGLVSQLLDGAAQALASRAVGELDAATQKLCAQAEQIAPPLRRDEARPLPANLDELFELVVQRLDDDGPRRVCADALLEAGDARGDFIRAQLDGQPTAALEKTAAVAAWLQPLKQVGALECKRGFPEAVRLYRSAKPDPTHPAWRTVRSITGLDELAAERALALINSPQLLNLRALSLPERVLREIGPGQRAWTRLGLEVSDGADLSLAPFSALEDLTLELTTLSPQLFAATPKLHTLWLKCTSVPPNALEPLTQLRTLELQAAANGLVLPETLEELDLTGQFTNTRFERCTRLKTLKCDASALAHAPDIPSLRTANLSASSDDAHAFDGLSGLHELSIDFDSQLAVTALQPLKQLQRLDLGYIKGLTRAHFEGLVALVQLTHVWADCMDFPPLPSLRTFHCMSPKSPAELAPLLQVAPKLETLDLNWNSGSSLYFYSHSPKDLKAGPWETLARLVKPTAVRVVGLHENATLVRDGGRWRVELRGKEYGQEDGRRIAEAACQVFERV